MQWRYSSNFRLNGVLSVMFLIIYFVFNICFMYVNIMCYVFNIYVMLDLDIAGEGRGWQRKDGQSPRSITWPSSTTIPSTSTATPPPPLHPATMARPPTFSYSTTQQIIVIPNLRCDSKSMLPEWVPPLPPLGATMLGPTLLFKPSLIGNSHTIQSVVDAYLQS